MYKNVKFERLGNLNVSINELNSQKKNFMATFYGWGSTASKLHSHYEETVYFLPLSPQKFLVLILLTSEG